MRAALELVVRPFVVKPVTSPKQPGVATDVAGTQKNIVKDIGGDSVTTWSGSFNQTVSFYFIKKPKEKKKSGSSDPFAPDPAFPGDVAP